MVNERLVIRGLSYISSLGASSCTSAADFWRHALRLAEAPVQFMQTSEGRSAVFPISPSAEEIVSQVALDDNYQRLDRTAQLSISALRGTLSRLESSELDQVPIECVSIGSSRGPTMALEESWRSFERDRRVATLTSPITTAGNVSSWVAQDYLAQSLRLGQANELVTLSTSMTCSSAFHALLVARSFVVSGMAGAALFGGTEACLTPYTVAQLAALRIYASSEHPWPCRPLDFTGGANSGVLGEGAGSAVLQRVRSDSELMTGDLELLGVGWGLEGLQSPTSISEDGLAIEFAMRRALAAAGGSVKVGAVVLHAPGSRRGDQAESGAVKRVCGDALLCSAKHLTGHTYGASGMLGLGLAEGLLQGVEWTGFPYLQQQVGKVKLGPGEAVMVNTAGFGGNAVSVLVGRVA
jgi:3-oxoacyl-(acyl-carrier-protein) synthase